ncbi:hypothetical protein [Mycolicibacterium bacteremicum]|uniref:hypothetical protein n=1 Tax=Mycolicibacterium bacteremicum TaxID=564198 RepID=UPI0026EFA36B|nr:hypothetical protein [Mycolicibacterium bacteremicum]
MSRPNATELAARKERLSTIRRCRRCDPCGWALDTAGVPIDPAVRCTHGVSTPHIDVTAPPHEPDLFTEPRHSRTETED